MWTFSVINAHKQKAKEQRKKVILGLAWIAVTVVYVDVYIKYLSGSSAFIIFAMILGVFVIGVLLILFELCPDITYMFVAAYKTRKYLKKFKFIKIGDTRRGQEKRVRSLLFLDHP